MVTDLTRWERGGNEDGLSWLPTWWWRWWWGVGCSVIIFICNKGVIDTDPPIKTLQVHHRQGRPTRQATRQSMQDKTGHGTGTTQHHHICMSLKWIDEVYETINVLIVRSKRVLWEITPVSMGWEWTVMWEITRVLKIKELCVTPQAWFRKAGSTSEKHCERKREIEVDKQRARRTQECSQGIWKIKDLTIQEKPCYLRNPLLVIDQKSNWA